MALDRTWYNTLIDDDGSGLTGSVWDKADVDSLMDAIDAELGRVEALHGGGGFVPQLIGSGGGTPAYTLQNGWYRRTGTGSGSTLIWIGGRISCSSRGSLAGAVYLGGLPSPPNPNVGMAGPAFGYFNGLNAASMGCYNTNGLFALTFVATTFPTVGSQLVDASFFPAAIDLIFAGSYLA